MRRSYDIPPPAVSKTDERYPAKDPRYVSLKPEEIPLISHEEIIELNIATGVPLVYELKDHLSHSETFILWRDCFC